MSSTTNNTNPRRMVQLRYVLMPFAIILAAILVLIVFIILAPKPAKKPVITKAPLVEVVNIQREGIVFNIASQGSVVPRTQTVLISEVSGKITSVNDKFNVGGYFTKGEVLLTIDDINYQVALLQAQSTLDSTKATLVQEQARKEQAEQEWRLTGKKLSQAPVLALRLPQLQKAQADVKAAEANLQQANIKLARTKIKAPYDAMIKAKQVEIGQYVTMGSAMATIFAVDYAEVRLPVKQRDVEFLNLPKINQTDALLSTVTISYNVLGKVHSWSSALTRYEGEVDSKNRVHYVIAQIDDPYGINSQKPELRIGTFINANIIGKKVEDIVAIPRNAVHGANTLYFVNHENRLHIQKINILHSDANFVYSHDSFVAKHRLIMTQLQSPVEGMKLRIVGEHQKKVPTTEASDSDSNAEQKGEH